MGDKQVSLIKPKLITADPTIRRRVLKLGDPRIPKDSHSFHLFCMKQEPAKVYISQDHFDYLMDDYDEETYRVFGKSLKVSNEFVLFLKEEEGRFIYINTEVVIK